MRKLLRNYFTLSKRERNAMLSVSIILLIAIIIRTVQVFHTSPLSTTEIQVLNNELDELIKTEQATDENNETKNLTPLNTSFNPNALSKEQWLQYGLSPKQANTICNYVLKGGKFIYKEDLEKVYGLSNEQKARLIPLINLPSKSETTLTNLNYKDTNAFVININQADSSSLVSLMGIGPVFAKRIIKYRAALGGFHSIEQLYEVYGIDNETINKLSNRLSIGNTEVKKLNINTVTTEELKTHPYIDFKTSKAIIKYREANGNYNKLEDLKKVYIVNDSIFKKLAPYISLND